MANPSRERSIRIIILVLCGLSFPIHVAAGVMSSRTWRTLQPVWFEFIPIGLSAILSSVYILLDQKRSTSLDGDTKPKGHRRPWVWVIMDLFLAIAYFCPLVPIWAYEPRHMNRHADLMMLETYATCFFIINLVLHVCLAIANFRGLCEFFRSFSLHDCPRCRGKIVYNGPDMMVRKSGEGYSLLRGEDYLDDDAVEYGVVAGPSEARPSEESRPSEDNGTGDKGAIQV